MAEMVDAGFRSKLSSFGEYSHCTLVHTTRQILFVTNHKEGARGMEIPDTKDSVLGMREVAFD
jgi:hypothetical protein